jgi:DNA primase
MKYNELLNTNQVLDLLIKHLNFSPVQRGKSIFFLCPFHEDSNPSLGLEPNRKIFKCFACNFSARNIFEFWAKYKFGNKEITPAQFRQALEEISKLGYLPSSVWQKAEGERTKSRNRIVDLFALVTDIYQHNLLTPLGKEVLNYLHQRQLNNELIDRFSLGCSISNKQITTLLFQEKGANSEDLLITNLVQVNDNNHIYDYFPANQLVLPLKNELGEIVALATRKMVTSSQEGKYNYLPNYSDYQKSSLLYNYSSVKQSRAEEVYLVEGFFDVISLTRLGTENCLAILGTSLSTSQLSLLYKLKKRIVLFLDGDRAGWEATVGIAVSLLLNEVDCEIVKHDYQNDPDEICCRYGGEIVQNILRTRQNPYLFILDYYSRYWEIKENPQRIARFIGDIAKVFAKFKENIHRFLMERVSILTTWSQEEVEAHFAPRRFPVLHINQHCQKIIQEKEAQIITFCTCQRKFWLIVIQSEYFFKQKINRQYYQNIYNYYMVTPTNKFFPEKYYNLSLENIKEDLAQIFLTVDEVWKFSLSANNYYEKNQKTF